MRFIVRTMSWEEVALEVLCGYLLISLCARAGSTTVAGLIFNRALPRQFVLE